MSNLWTWCAVLSFLAACGVARVELIPPAVGHRTIDVKVVAESWGGNSPDWYDAYEIDLTNSTTAPIDVRLPEIHLELVSLIDGVKYTYQPHDGGVGELPATAMRHNELPKFVRVEPNDTAKVWVAFGGKPDPRSALARTILLAVPGADEIVIDARTPDHPSGIRQFEAPRRAVGLAFRSYADLTAHHLAVSVPFVTGVSFVLCRLQVDGHAGYQSNFDVANGQYVRSGGFVGGGSAVWHFSTFVSLYSDLDYERRLGGNAAAIGGGAALTLTNAWDDPRAFHGFHRPTAQFRLGWVQTVTNSDTWGAIRFGFEFDGLAYF